MEIVLNDIGDLVKTWAADGPTMYKVGDTTKIGKRTYEFCKFSTAAVRGNYVYRIATSDSTTGATYVPADDSVTTTGLAGAGLGWTVAATVTIDYCGWVQTWGILMYDNTHRFKGLLTIGTAGAIGDRIIPSLSSVGKGVRYSSGAPLQTIEMATLLTAIGTTSPSAYLFARDKA
jgi:hypothetical protein